MQRLLHGGTCVGTCFECQAEGARAPNSAQTPNTLRQASLLLDLSLPSLLPSLPRPQVPLALCAAMRAPGLPYALRLLLQVGATCTLGINPVALCR